MKTLYNDLKSAEEALWFKELRTNQNAFFSGDPIHYFDEKEKL